MKTGKLRADHLLYPFVGGLLGLAYVLLDEGVLDHLPANVSIWIGAAHEFMDGVLPVLLGMTAGAGIYLLRRHRRLVQRLSLKNESLQNDLLFHTLVSQMLHEIRNPIHAIHAALENPEALDAQEQKQLILRNLDRVNQLKKLYEAKESVFDRLNAREPLRVDLWFPGLLEDKIQTRLRETHVQFSHKIEPIQVLIHPLLLEQVLLTLLANAVQAAGSTPDTARWIKLEISRSAERPGCAEIRISNGGAAFPAEVLEAQADRPVKSENGHGLGLLLARKLLEQAEGRMRLENRGGHAQVTVWIPAKPA